MDKLVKYVARVSALSRRKSESLIKAGKVKVNSLIVKDLSASINPRDSVAIDNEIIKSEPFKLYIALNKPVGYISDLKDRRGRKLARDLINIDVRLFPVGRLDYHSEGLMIFTNDGDFANVIMHPKYEVEKEYLVKIKGILKKEEMQRMQDGIVINGEIYKVKGIHYIRDAQKNIAREMTKKPTSKTIPHSISMKVDKRYMETKNTWYSITVNEGKNRMIRKIGDAIKHPVLKLRRVRIGRLRLDTLQSGKYKYFEMDEATGNAKNRRRRG